MGSIHELRMRFNVPVSYTLAPTFTKYVILVAFAAVSIKVVVVGQFPYNETDLHMDFASGFAYNGKRWHACCFKARHGPIQDQAYLHGGRVLERIPSHV